MLKLPKQRLTLTDSYIDLFVGLCGWIRNFVIARAVAEKGERKQANRQYDTKTSAQKKCKPAMARHFNRWNDTRELNNGKGRQNEAEARSDENKSAFQHQGFATQRLESS